jgi:hypothetical protein
MAKKRPDIYLELALAVAITAAAAVVLIDIYSH